MHGKIKNIIGEKFGTLTVTRLHPERNKHNSTQWYCDCDCGNKDVLRARQSLVRGKPSCGCIKTKTGFQDLTGEKFGKLIVIKRHSIKKNNQIHWWCTCSCGFKSVLVSRNSLATGATKSCGCVRQLDLIGTISGYLTVVSQSIKRDKRGRKLWDCVCCCDKHILAETTTLKTGAITSCGCMRGQKNIVDITGNTYGTLTVVKRSAEKTKNKQVRWWCTCSCGFKSVLIIGNALKTGNTKSCGCSQYKKVNLVGRKYGILTVTKMLEEKDKSGNHFVLCDCDCGVENHKVRRNNLLSGNASSCGCEHQKMKLNLVGNRYNGLVVTDMVQRKVYGKAQTMCICTCMHCGNKKYEVRASDIQSNKAKSCGCRTNKIKSLVGQRIGKLTVIKLSEKRGAAGQILWECDCDCGVKGKLVKAAQLSNGQTKSCGCLWKETLKKAKESNNYREVLRKITEQNNQRTILTKTCNVSWEESKKLIADAQQIKIQMEVYNGY